VHPFHGCTVSKYKTGSRGADYMNKKTQIKKNKAKEEEFTARRGEERGNKMATQAISPPPPVATLGPEPAEVEIRCVRPFGKRSKHVLCPPPFPQK
jgi:hypothetical protein